MTGKIIEHVRNNRENLYLLHEAVEGLVFCLEQVAHKLNGEVAKSLAKPLAGAREALKLVKINQDEAAKLLQDEEPK
jgi:hypothetical protein